MPEIESTLCPICDKAIPALALSSHYCPVIHSMKLARSKSESDLYIIVPEGKGYAIAYQGKAEVHELNPEDLPRAQEVISLLNSLIACDNKFGDSRKSETA